MRRRLFFRHSVSAALMTMMLCSAAAANEEPGWQWRVTPLYYWALNIQGNQASGSSNTPIDTDRFDFEFEGAFSIDFEGTYDDRWGFVGDLIWTDLSNTDTSDGSTLDFRYLQAEIDGYYRWTVRGQTIDWLAGLRYYTNNIELNPSDISGRADWIDPIVGVRWTWPFADDWYVSFRGNVGGFGIGSDLSWQVLALADWQPWKHVSLVGGARVVTVDYSSGAGSNLFVYDITMWGPILGVSIKW